MATQADKKKIPLAKAGCKYCSYSGEMTLLGSQKGPCPRCCNVKHNTKGKRSR